MLDFKELIEEDRKKNVKDTFQGTLLDYLNLLKEDTSIPSLAHKRIYDIIYKEGLEVLNPEDNHRIRKIYGNEIEGDLCPICKYKLQNKYKGEFEKVPIVKSEFSIRSRKGIGIVPPID